MSAQTNNLVSVLPIPIPTLSSLPMSHPYHQQPGRLSWRNQTVVSPSIMLGVMDRRQCTRTGILTGKWNYSKRLPIPLHADWGLDGKRASPSIMFGLMDRRHCKRTGVPGAKWKWTATAPDQSN